MEVTTVGIANIGIPGLILILVVALIVFGPSKLPEIGKAAGQTLKAFKSSVNENITDDEKEKDQSTDKKA